MVLVRGASSSINKTVVVEAAEVVAIVLRYVVSILVKDFAQLRFSCLFVAAYEMTGELFDTIPHHSNLSMKSCFNTMAMRLGTKRKRTFVNF